MNNAYIILYEAFSKNCRYLLLTDEESDETLSDIRQKMYLHHLKKLNDILNDTYHPLEEPVLGEHLSLLNLMHVNISIIEFIFIGNLCLLLNFIYVSVCYSRISVKVW